MQQTNSRAEEVKNGHAVRGSETRAKMIREAIEVFAALGYQGASTRTIAEQAGVNLAAIPYHFGGKHELYLAAAQTIADYARERMALVIARLCDADRADQTTRIDEALSSFIDLVVGDAEPEAWTSFFVRCEHDADGAFRMIYEEVVAGFQRALTETVAEAIDCDAGDENLRIRVAIVLASIVNFRTLRNMTLRTLGWDQLNPNRLEQLNRAIRQFAFGELLSIPAKALSPSRNRSRRKSVQGQSTKERNNVETNPRR
jgi:AcrR family transcriptional regulator